MKCNPSVTFHLQGTILTYQHATSDYTLRFKTPVNCSPNFALQTMLAKFEEVGMFQSAALYRNIIKNGIATLLDIPRYLQHFSHMTRTNSIPKKWCLLFACTACSCRMKDASQRPWKSNKVAIPLLT